MHKSRNCSICVVKIKQRKGSTDTNNHAIARWKYWNKLYRVATEVERAIIFQHLQMLIQRGVDSISLGTMCLWIKHYQQLLSKLKEETEVNILFNATCKLWLLQQNKFWKVCFDCSTLRGKFHLISSWILVKIPWCAEKFFPLQQKSTLSQNNKNAIHSIVL